MLILDSISEKTIIRVINPPVIGAKYAGPNCFHDTQNGVFWNVMSRLSDGECKIQRAFLKHEASLYKEMK